MNKSDIVTKYHEVVRTLGVAEDWVVVTAGSAMVLYDLRSEAATLNIEVCRPLFKRAWMMRCGTLWVSDIGTNVIRDFVQDCNLHLAPPSTTSKMVGGVCCAELEEILSLKRRLNRLKDQKDIAVLQARLYSSN